MFLHENKPFSNLSPIGLTAYWSSLDRSLTQPMDFQICFLLGYCKRRSGRATLFFPPVAPDFTMVLCFQ